MEVWEAAGLTPVFKRLSSLYEISASTKRRKNTFQVKAKVYKLYFLA
jgi:hypothetical protein